MVTTEIEHDFSDLETLPIYVDFYSVPPFSDIIEEFHRRNNPVSSGVVSVINDLPFLLTRAAEIISGTNTDDQRTLDTKPYKLLYDTRQNAAYKGDINQSRLIGFWQELRGRLDDQAPGWVDYINEQRNPRVYGDTGYYLWPRNSLQTPSLALTYRAWRKQQDRAQPPSVPPVQL